MRTENVALVVSLTILCGLSSIGLGLEIQELPPVAAEYGVVVDKSRHRLYLVGPAGIHKSYVANTGMVGGPKQHEGDLRTPEGTYRIIAVEAPPSDSVAFGSCFFRLNYPNYEDRTAGKTGSGIGIHGTRRKKVTGEDATQGCIVLNDSDIRELMTYLRVGSVVSIYGHIPRAALLFGKGAAVRERAFGNLNWQTDDGIVRYGRPLTICQEYWETEHDALWGDMVFCFSKDAFTLDSGAKQEMHVIETSRHFVVRVRTNDWPKGRKRVFCVEVVPLKNKYEPEFTVRLELRHDWGFVTFPQFGFLDGTGYPAKSVKLPVVESDPEPLAGESMGR